MQKISIIGAAGTLGASCAMNLALNSRISELCLLDINEALLDNHIMDLENAFPDKYIYRGNYEDLAGSSIVVITAGVPNRNEETSRDAYLMENVKIFKHIGANIRKYCSNAIIITASNPVDLLNYYLHKEFGFKPHQLIGYTLNDSYRFSWAINKVLNGKNQVYSPVIGEHGETQVPIFSQVRINNKEASFTVEEKKQIQEEIKTWFVKFNQLNIQRTTGWTTGVGISQLVGSLLSDQEVLTIGSVILRGEYNSQGISIGVPISVNREGVKQIIEWDLTVEENKDFCSSVEKISKNIEESFLLKEEM
ncbi:malate dehydrogenase [Halalkalibacter krulwichiae]|uniref:L-lactate dehydrogenase 1 n=1 Tax=Halalkalibacter krulwichiae TaxID=199441 RepID=A0A1X9M5Z5_9BACI|nr:hypothetical protein [Halalkalibacter krulwichiae]ARK28875.1 L-lactate dehydrogenase 1 [Halalkalibacter krulwichiae]